MLGRKEKKKRKQTLALGHPRPATGRGSLEGCLLSLQAIDAFVQLEPTGEQAKGPHLSAAVGHHAGAG